MTVTKGSPSPSPTASGGASDAQSQALAAILGGLSSSTGASAGKVYMGAQGAKSLTPAQLAALPPSALEQVQKNGAKVADTWMDTATAESQYFSWSAKQRNDFIAKGLLSGLLTKGAGDLEGSQLWKQLVDQASSYGAQGAKVSPLDILSGYVKGNSSGGWIRDGDFETNPATGERRYVGPKFKTTTQTNADLTDPATARAIAVNVFQSLLGRDPGQGEIDAYASALQQSEQLNPQTATTTTEFDPTTGEAVNSATVTAGGVTADGQQQMAADQIKQKKEYGATQAATTYQNALEQAVYGGH